MAPSSVQENLSTVFVYLFVYLFTIYLFKKLSHKQPLGNQQVGEKH